jgi:two-component system nitrogen regulation response regulator GlnG
MQANSSDGKSSGSQNVSYRWDSATYRIVFVEDNPRVLEPITTALCVDGHNVRSTTHGSELFHLIEVLDPDILITDIMMEEIDVLDVIAQLHESRPRLKIIAISANPHLLTLASRNGANHVLAKPFPLERLNLLIKVTMQ